MDLVHNLNVLKPAWWREVNMLMYGFSDDDSSYLYLFYVLLSAEFIVWRVLLATVTIRTHTHIATAPFRWWISHKSQIDDKYDIMASSQHVAVCSRARGHNFYDEYLIFSFLSRTFSRIYVTPRMHCVYYGVRTWRTMRLIARTL